MKNGLFDKMIKPLRGSVIWLILVALLFTVFSVTVFAAVDYMTSEENTNEGNTVTEDAVTVYHISNDVALLSETTAYTLDDYKAAFAKLPATPIEQDKRVKVNGFPQQMFMGSVYIFEDEECSKVVAGSEKTTGMNITLKGQLTGAAKLTEVKTKAVAYLEDGKTYWVKAFNSAGAENTTYAYVFTVIANENNEYKLENVQKTKYTFSTNIEYLVDAIETEGLNVADYQLGGTAVLTDADGKELQWDKVEKTEYNGVEYETGWVYYFPVDYKGILNFKFTPTDSKLKGDSDAVRKIEQIIDGMGTNPRTHSFYVYPVRERIIRVPNEYKDYLTLYSVDAKHYFPHEKIEPDEIRENVVSGYTDFVLKTGREYKVFAILDAPGALKIAHQIFYTQMVSDDDEKNVITIHGYSKNKDDYVSHHTDFASANFKEFALDNGFRVDNDYLEANLYLSVPDNNYINMAVGGDGINLMPLRTWQAVDNVVGNSYVEPNYHYKVYGESVELTETGEEWSEYAVIQPVKSGVSLIAVTYDALYYSQYSDGREKETSGGIASYYNAIEPINTRVVVVNVGGKNTANIKTNIADGDKGVGTEFDTIYFAKTINGEKQAKQYADFTFTPHIRR